MAGPPTNIEPSELWAKLQDMPRPHRVVDFPRLGPDGNPVGQVAIWPLSQQEQIAAVVEAERFAQTLLRDNAPGDLGYEIVFASEGAAQTLWRACRAADEPKRPAFPSPAAIREKFTTDELGELFEQYMAVQRDLAVDRSRVPCSMEPN
jgi:hypothetical protein